jgi:ubiquinone/menaquinone biosynthesis C-methylase UbiE
MSYVKAFESDIATAQAYLLKSLEEKTQQQIRLEEILASQNLEPLTIADICCGSGALSLHLSRLYSKASFTLVDLGEQALSIARKVAQPFSGDVIKGDIYGLSLPTDYYDLVFCWQTLSWIDEPRQALQELMRICKPGGRVFCSALFNTEYDVALLVKAIDHTRAANVRYSYNVLSLQQVQQWVDGVTHFHRFEMPIDLPKKTRGLGTHTVKCDDGSRLQISGGMLMNWKILEIVK